MAPQSSRAVGRPGSGCAAVEDAVTPICRHSADGGRLVRVLNRVALTVACLSAHIGYGNYRRWMSAWVNTRPNRLVSRLMAPAAFDEETLMFAVGKRPRPLCIRHSLRRRRIDARSTARKRVWFCSGYVVITVQARSSRSSRRREGLRDVTAAEAPRRGIGFRRPHRGMRASSGREALQARYSGHPTLMGWVAESTPC